MGDFSTDVMRNGARSVLRLHGEVNRGAAEPLRTAWAEAATDADTVVLDFSGMSYLNSSGIAVIVGLLADARVDNITVRARGLDDHYRHVFELTRISDLMELED